MDITVLPNPVVDMLTVSVKASTIKEVSLYKSIGQQIIRQIGANMDVSNRSPGIYFVRAIDASGRSYTKKIIKL